MQGVRMKINKRPYHGLLSGGSTGEPELDMLAYYLALCIQDASHDKQARQVLRTFFTPERLDYLKRLNLIPSEV